MRHCLGRVAVVRAEIKEDDVQDSIPSPRKTTRGWPEDVLGVPKSRTRLAVVTVTTSSMACATTEITAFLLRFAVFATIRIV